MRLFALILLWLGVVGFGLMTLCSGVFLPMAPWIALPFGLLSGLFVWACILGLRHHHRNRPTTPSPEATAAAPAPGSDATDRRP